MLCDCRLFLSPRVEWIRVRGLPVHRVLLEREIGPLPAIRTASGGYHPLEDLDNFREGEEHPSVVALLGPLDGRSKEESND